jgi:hypothetical protein
MQMIRKMPGTAGVWCLFAIASVWAQGPSRQPIPDLSFRYAKPARDTGTSSRALIVHVEVAPGWHINSDAPLDEFLVPTKVEAKAVGWEFGRPRYPKPERTHSDAMGGDMLLFSGAFDVEVSGRPASAARNPAAAQDPPRTRVTLRYQACDHATCYPPKEVTVER